MTVRLGPWSPLTRRWVLGVVPALLALTARISDTPPDKIGTPPSNG